MRVKGPEGGPPPPDQIDETAATGAAAPTDATQAVGSTGGAAPAAGAQAARGVAGGLVDEIARRLRAGELTPHEAVELLIDDAVDRQLGRVTTGRARLANELKDILRRFTESDPYLASKVRRLGDPRGRGAGRGRGERGPGGQ